MCEDWPVGLLIHRSVLSKRLQDERTTAGNSAKSSEMNSIYQMCTEHTYVPDGGQGGRGLRLFARDQQKTQGRRTALGSTGEAEADPVGWDGVRDVRLKVGLGDDWLTGHQTPRIGFHPGATVLLRASGLGCEDHIPSAFPLFPEFHAWPQGSATPLRICGLSDKKEAPWRGSQRWAHHLPEAQRLHWAGRDAWMWGAMGTLRHRATQSY